MSAPLRAVVSQDAQRANAVRAFLDRFTRSPNTERTMESALRSIVALFPERSADIWTFPWEFAADAQFFDEVQQRIAANYSSATVSKLMSTLRQLLKVLSRHGLLDADLLWSTLEGANPVSTVEAEPTRSISTVELRSMLAACRRDPNRAIGARDGAVLAVLAATGARRSEVAMAERRRFDLGEQTAGLRVKGGGWRTVALHPASIEYLRLWLSYGVTGSRVFCPVRKNGLVLVDRGISDKAIWKIVGRRREEAYLDPRVTPHSFRRWFVSSLLENGVDLLTVTRAVGHKHPGTTQKYDRREEAALRAAVLGPDLPSIEELDGHE